MLYLLHQVHVLLSNLKIHIIIHLVKVRRPVKNVSATLNILCAAFLSPIAILSDTNLDITDGIPILESVSISAYTSYPEA